MMRARSDRSAVVFRTSAGLACLLLTAVRAWPASPAPQLVSQPAPSRLGETNRISITLTTNYYRFGGTNQAQMRAAMFEARPWKDTQTYDALTKWDVHASYRFRRQEGGFAVEAVEVRTKVVLTLPFWLPGQPVSRDLVNRWNRCLSGLDTHERGHVALAQAAADAVRKRLEAQPLSPSPQLAAAAADRTVNDTIEEFRDLERRYDQATKHGFTQGAVFAADPPPPPEAPAANTRPPVAVRPGLRHP